MAMLTFDGDPDVLVGAFLRLSRDSSAIGAGLSLAETRFVCRRTRGLLVVAVFRTEQALKTFLHDDRWLDALAMAGFPEPRLSVFAVESSSNSDTRSRAA